MRKLALAAVVLAAAFLSMAAVPLSSASVSTPSVTGISQFSGVFIITSGPQANVTLAVQPGTNGSDAFPSWTFWLYGNSTYQITINGRIVQEGYNIGTGTFSYTFPTGSVNNVTVAIGGVIYRMTDVLIIPGVATHPYQNVYIESTYPGVNQQLIVYSNQTGVVTYAHMQIHMVSTTTAPYRIYVDGQFYQSGNLTTGTAVIHIFENVTAVSVVVDLGSSLYNFREMPVVKVPLEQKKTNPQQKPIYTAFFAMLLQVKLYIAAIMSIVIGALTIGTVGRAYMDTRIQH